MNVLELLVGRLALDRQLISEPLLQHCLQQGGQGMGDFLVAQGYPPDAVQALFAEAQHAQMLCTGCGARYGVAHLMPHDPWACRTCGRELILLGHDDSRRLGTGAWRAQHPGDYPTSTGSARTHMPFQNTPMAGDTRPGSDRWAGHPGVAPTGSGSGSWRGSGSGFSASQRFRSKLQPGTILDGHEILSELGRGGMGIVFKARHMGRGDLVALKVLLAGAMATERQQKRFQREAEALAKLNHPNIVRVFDMGDLGDHLYFTMEFVDGQPLGDQIKGKRISLRRAVEIARDVARGLQHAHEHEIIHRDIKPDNILIDQSGTPLITDFGLVRDAAHDVSRLTRSGAVLGTPYYMSPEQASGKGHHLEGSADVYSLGTVLYQMLTGELPFDGATQIELTKKIIEIPAPRPSKLNAAVPAELDAIVLKTLAKTPEQRYDSAADFADDLDRFLRGEPVEARPPSGFNPAAVAKVLGVVAGLLALVAVTAITVRALRGGGTPTPDASPTTAPVDPAVTQARQAALDEVEDLWRAAERAPIGVYRASLWKLVEGLDAALEVAPEVPRVHFLRGLVHDRLQKYDEARLSYAKAGELDPKGDVGARAVFHGSRLISRVDDDVKRAKQLVIDWQRGAGPAPDPPQGPWRKVLEALVLYLGDDRGAEQALRLLEQAERSSKTELGEVQALKSRLLFTQGNIEDAFDVLQQAIRIDPKDATNWSARASFYAAVREDIEQALRDVERALILDPENLRALELRGSIRVMRKEPVRGRRDLERVLQRKPASELALRNMAVLLMPDKPDRAMELMRRAEASAPEDVSPYLLQADMLISVDRLEDGLKALARGIERVYPDRSKRMRLALRFEELVLGARRIETMKRVARELDAKRPGNPISVVLRGHAATYEAKDPKASLRYWNDCLKPDLDSLFVWERRLRIRHTIEGPRSEDVRKEFERFVDAARQAKCSQALGYGARYAAIVAQDAARARRLATQATQADPMDTEAWVSRAFVELVADRGESGFRFLQRALAMQPENSEANYLMGRALMLSRKLDAAVRAFQRSVMLNPYSVEQIGVICSLLLRAKRYKAVMAITTRNGRRMQALELSPSPTLVLHRARALAELGRPERAMPLLDEMLKADLRTPRTVVYLAEVLGNVGRVKDAIKVLRAHLDRNPRDARAGKLLQKLQGGGQ